MEEKKKCGGLVIPFIIVILLLLGLIGYICYDKLFSKETIKTEKKEDTNKNKSYSYADIAGVYSFKTTLDPSGIVYSATLYLLSDGTFKYERVTSENPPAGYIGNYIIDGDKILFTNWFITTSGEGYNIPKASSTDILTDTAIINSDKTISYSKCYGDTIDVCKFERTSEQTDIFNNIHTALYTETYILVD